MHTVTDIASYTTQLQNYSTYINYIDLHCSVGQTIKCIYYCVVRYMKKHLWQLCSEVKLDMPLTISNIMKSNDCTIL